MNYRNKTFSVIVGGQAYSDNWERIFRGGQELAQAETPAPAPQAPPADPPMAPVTLRCGSCGHATTVTRREDFELHRGHTCSGRKTVIVDSKSELREAMSAGFHALFPATMLQGAADSSFMGAAPF